MPLPDFITVDELKLNRDLLVKQMVADLKRFGTDLNRIREEVWDQDEMWWVVNHCMDRDIDLGRDDLRDYMEGIEQEALLDLGLSPVEILYIVQDWNTCPICATAGAGCRVHGEAN